MRRHAALALGCLLVALQGCRAEPPERATTLELGPGPGTLDFENVSEPRFRNASGIGAHANIEASGEGMIQPARVKVSTNASRRPL